jgi:hypothetical protein
MVGAALPRHRRAWAAFVLTVFLLAAGYILTGLNAGNVHGATAAWNGFAELTSWAVLMLTAACLGVLIATRRPGNLVGPTFLATGVLGSLTVAGDQWAGYALVTHPGALPFGITARFVSFLAFAATWFVAGVLLPALFPSGHVVSRRWRAAVWMGAVGAAVWALIVFLPQAFHDDGLLGNVGSRNPIGVAPLADVLNAASGFGILALFGGMFLAIISLVVRAARGHGEERQQVKVVAYTVAVMTIVELVVANTFDLVDFPGKDILWQAFAEIAILAVPISIAVAVLRYRLYDIDRLINRTIVYATVTALLAAAYTGTVILTGTLARPLTGGSDLSIAVATLVIAGSFVPLRRRVQRFVDMRFYRSRYNAQRVLEAFILRMREQTDLDTLRSEIERVAAETMHPAHVGVWLPPGRLTRRRSS